MEIITSRTNPLCTHLRKLASSVSYRRDCGEFLCDSPKLLEEALLWRAGLRTVVCTDPAVLPSAYNHTVHLQICLHQVFLPDQVLMLSSGQR